MPIVWQSHSRLNPSLIFIIQKAIDRLSLTHLKSSANDEIFDISNETYERLQNYAFSQRFQIVIEFCEVDRRNYSCIHHKAEFKQRNKQKMKNSETTLSSDSLFFASFFFMLTLKLRDRLKDSKNQTFTVSIAFDETSFFFVSFVMTKTIKSDCAVKKTTVWKQKSQSRRRLHDSTLKIVTSKSVRKRSKSNLMTTATLNERESQQKRLIESTFIIE